jgi:hypothetical protein
VFDSAIYCHPENVDLLKRRFPASERGGIFPLFASMPVYSDHNMPKRFTQEIWHPPGASRFTEYGPEDEAWMRPLGLGHVETKDNGPAFYQIDTSMWRPMIPIYA